MTDTTTSQEHFEIVRRGYEPQQVDRRIAALVTELEQTRRRTADLERRVEELHLQQQEQGETAAPTYAGLGTRIEKILGLAEEEARDLRAAAVGDAEQHRSLTEQDAGKIRSEADRYSRERRSEVDAEAARVIEEARRQADQLRDEAERETKARREEAEALFEQNRAKAAQAAADFETTLAQRRDQSERDFTEKMSGATSQLSAVEQRAEQTRLEAEKLRADADRKSKRMLEEAQRQADDRIAEAKATADRIRGESERELTAATQRRDSINAQLTNVRQMLATLTGATLPNPLGDDDDDPVAGAPGAAGKPQPVTPSVQTSVPGKSPQGGGQQGQPTGQNQQAQQAGSTAGATKADADQPKVDQPGADAARGEQPADINKPAAAHQGQGSGGKQNG